MIIKRVFVVWLFLTVVVFAGTSCVSKKKYNSMETLKNKVQDMLDKKNKQTADLNDEIKDLEKQLKDCESARTALAADTARLRKSSQASAENLAELKASCERMQENYDNLKNKSSRKIRDLIDELEALQGNVGALQADLESREKRLKDVERKLAFRDSVMNALQDKITGALLNFKGKDLSVEVKNGKVYVTLSNRLLFASGSWKIDTEGKKALQDLAGVLKEQQDITIMVEGHTDNVPVSNLGQIKDNWDLSVMRSTEVIRILTGEGVDPTHVIPAGRGEYVPLKADDSKESRAENRRTEIVLTPNLDELWNLISNK
ncbi:MAG: OmpA family protein [Bacteroidia bacterium]|nr:OmpA family protein [Bacteroidia bacterium]